MWTGRRDVGVQEVVQKPGHHILAGDCGGLAEYFGTDSTLIRAIVAAAILAGGSVCPST